VSKKTPDVWNLDRKDRKSRIVPIDGTDDEKIEFRLRAANLYERAANHRDVTQRDIVESMHYFSGSGNARKTIALGNIFANHPDTTIDYFYETVNRLFLGIGYLIIGILL
jgi:hypothetical protein